MNRRRQNAADSGEGQRTNRSVAVLTSAAFRQVLIKCSQRFVRQGRGFSLIALQVLEFEQVKRSLSDQAADQLSNLACSTFLKGIRGADRLCVAKPGHFIILMPDTDAAGAQVAVDRLCHLVAQAKSHFKHKPLRASCSYKVAHCEQFLGDAEAMLRSLGYSFDNDGELGFAGQSQSLRLESSEAPGLGGGFVSWFERYEITGQCDLEEFGDVLQLTRLAAKDQWASDRPVRIRVAEMSSGTAFDTDVLAVLARRSRVLQSIDHPGIDAIIDFQVKDNRALYLVNKRRAEPSLAEFLETANAFDSDLISQWAVQICNSLIYLQSLMPPVVPASLSFGCFIVNDQKHLVLVDYELPYLLPAFCQGFNLSELEIQAVIQGRPTPAYEPVVRSLGRMLGRLAGDAGGERKFVELLERLQAEKLPADLNTIYKVRSALKAVCSVS